MPRPRRRVFPKLLALLAAGVLLTSVNLTRADESTPQEGRRRGADREARAEKKDDGLTLEKAFPERSPFGPSASSVSFSRDGRFAAFLYRPYNERRHGSDLYVYDTQAGTSRRMTSASRLAEWQAGARKVVEDRTKKARDARHPKVAGIDGRGKPPATQPATQSTTQPAEPPPTAEPAQPDPLEAILGGYTGQIGDVSEPGALAPGMPVRVMIEKDGESFTGQIAAGLVRLPLTGLSLEGEVFKAVVGGADEGVEGSADGTVTRSGDAVTIAGTARLTQPALEFGFEVTRQTRPKPAAPAPEAAVASADAAKPEAPAAPAAAKADRTYATGLLQVEGEQLELGDLVTDKDAEDERAPRYGGVQSFEWHPRAHEMLVQSDGDVYRLTLDDAKWEEADEHARPYRGEMQRLTRTRERESSVAYLPDGSGYTYLRSGALLKVSFGDHAIVQLDPALEDGEQMVSYRLSPDGKRVVFLAQRREGQRPGDGGTQRGERRGDDDGDDGETNTRQVTLISYRDRFATARQVPRMVADDDFPKTQASIYLYELAGHDEERPTPKRVFTRQVTGPRDVTYVPHWAPDSSKVAFAVFEQATSNVLVLEAGFDDTKPGGRRERGGPATRPAGGDGATADADHPAGDGAFLDVSAGTADEFGGGRAEDEAQERMRRGGGQGGPPTGAPPATQPASQPAMRIDGAEIVYKFLHDGGPNTPRMIIPQYLADSRHLVFVAELSGFRHLHVLDPVYQQLEQLTTGKREIYPFQISEDHKRLFVTATVENDPAQEWAYVIDLQTRQMKRLCEGEGVINGPAVSDDGTKLIATKADFGGPSEMIAFDCSGEASVPTVLSDFHPKAAHELTAVKPEYFSFQNRHGHAIHGHMFKPKDWQPTDKRPLLMYVYGGPLGEDKMITRGSYAGPSYFFARYMAEKHGWVTATIDPRGASGLGAVFEKANFGQVGKPQTEDLVDAANWLTEHAGVDAKRRALHGWSFGGFQTQMVMYTEPEAFAAGIAGAGPTEWQNYNSWYTTGTVGPKSDFKADLDQHSLLPLAKNLKGRLLLVHGVEDSNVLYQDTVRVYRELLRANKEYLVDLFIDPTGGHGLGGDVKNIGRYRKFADFLVTHVGEGKPGSPPPEDDSLGSDRPKVAEATPAAGSSE